MFSEKVLISALRYGQLNVSICFNDKKYLQKKKKKFFTFILVIYVPINGKNEIRIFHFVVKYWFVIVEFIILIVLHRSLSRSDQRKTTAMSFTTWIIHSHAGTPTRITNVYIIRYTFYNVLMLLRLCCCYYDYLLYFFYAPFIWDARKRMFKS